MVVEVTRSIQVLPIPRWPLLCLWMLVVAAPTSALEDGSRALKPCPCVAVSQGAPPPSMCETAGALCHAARRSVVSNFALGSGGACWSRLSKIRTLSLSVPRPSSLTLVDVGLVGRRLRWKGCSTPQDRQFRSGVAQRGIPSNLNHLIGATYARWLIRTSGNPFMVCTELVPMLTVQRPKIKHYS